AEGSGRFRRPGRSPRPASRYTAAPARRQVPPGSRSVMPHCGNCCNVVNLVAPPTGWLELFFTGHPRCYAFPIRLARRDDVHLRLLDLDGSLDDAGLRAAAPWQSVQSVPLRDLAARLRLWSRAATMRQARERLAAAPGPALTLIGSGDFHHLAVPLIE